MFTEWDLNLFRIEYSRQGHLIANLRSMGEEPGPTTITAAPNGEDYYIPSHLFTL